MSRKENGKKNRTKILYTSIIIDRPSRSLFTAYKHRTWYSLIVSQTFRACLLAYQLHTVRSQSL